MGDRIVVMLDGEIQQVATPLELYNKPANRFVATFIGSPPMNVLRGKVLAEEEKHIFACADGGCTLDVPDHLQTVMADYEGREVLAGIRPEDLHENPQQTARQGHSIVAPVEVVEPMGAETNLYLKVGEASVIARVAPHVQPPVGEDHILDVNLERLHFFDAETERAIR